LAPGEGQALPACPMLHCARQRPGDCPGVGGFPSRGQEARMLKNRLVMLVSALALVVGACSAPAAPAPSLSGAALGAGPTGEAAVPAPAAATAAAPPARHALVSYVPSLSFVPLFLAVEKGYLTAEGVDVDLQVGRSASAHT